MAMISAALPKAKVCFACRDVIDVHAVVCPRCGSPQPAVLSVNTSDKRILPAFLLCFLLGVFGAHRFYAGKIGTGVLELLTLGGFGIWWLVDLILIVTGSFRDGDGQKISEWT
jgi:TM2 domain-containing membrane protein YozV